MALRPHHGVAAESANMHFLATKNTSETLCERPVRDKRGPGLRSVMAGLALSSLAFILRVASKIQSPCGGNRGWSTTLW